MTWKDDLERFRKEMEEKIQKNIKAKGAPEKAECRMFNRAYMLRKAMEHAECENYVDAANYLFMLWNGEDTAQVLTIFDNPKESQVQPKGVTLSDCGSDQKEK